MYAVEQMQTAKFLEENKSERLQKQIKYAY